MEQAIQINKKLHGFNIRFLLILIAVAIMSLLLSNYFMAKHNSMSFESFALAGSVTEFSADIDDISEIAEEIYSSGTIADAVENLPLEASLKEKMKAEIERILAKTTDYPGCEVYFLYTFNNGYYPVLGYANAILGMEYMKLNEVWKVGQTCNGQEGRYPRNIYYSSKVNDLLLTSTELRYQEIANGNYKQMLILEKILIYTYPFWSGHSNLFKPPGCKIYR